MTKCGSDGTRRHRRVPHSSGIPHSTWASSFNPHLPSPPGATCPIQPRSSIRKCVSVLTRRHQSSGTGWPVSRSKAHLAAWSGSVLMGATARVAWDSQAASRRAEACSPAPRRPVALGLRAKLGCWWVWWVYGCVTTRLSNRSSTLAGYAELTPGAIPPE